MPDRNAPRPDDEFGKVLSADDQPWESLEEFQTEGGEPCRRFERRVSVKTLLLLAYVLIGVTLPLGGLFLLLDQGGHTAAKAALGLGGAAGFLTLVHWWRDHRAVQAVNLDPTGVVIEYRRGLRALRWADVERVRDSFLTGATTLSGPAGKVSLSWMMERAEEMGTYIADRLREQGRIDMAGVLAASGVRVDGEGLEALSAMRLVRVPWERVTDIRLHLPDPAETPNYGFAGRPSAKNIFCVIVETDDVELRLRGVESNLTLYAALVLARNSARNADGDAGAE